MNLKPIKEYKNHFDIVVFPNKASLPTVEALHIGQAGTQQWLTCRVVPSSLTYLLK